MGSLGIDADAYRDGALNLIHGSSLYPLVGWNNPNQVPFIYPPPSAFIFIPLVWLSQGTAYVVIAAAGICSLNVALVICARQLGWSLSPAVLNGVSVAACSIPLDPFRSEILTGQINLILMAMIVIDCLATGNWKWRGLLIGIGGAVKLTPLCFIIYFIIRREFQAAIVATATFIGFVTLGFTLDFTDSHDYWLIRLPSHTLIPEWFGPPLNESLHGLLTGLFGHQHSWLPWVLVVIPTVVLTVAAASRLSGAGRPVESMLVIGIGAILCYPIAWTQYWVWVSVGLLILLRDGPRQKWRLAALVCCCGIFGIGPRLLPLLFPVLQDPSPPSVLLGEIFTVVGLTVLILAFALSRSLKTEVHPIGDNVVGEKAGITMSGSQRRLN